MPIFPKFLLHYLFGANNRIMWLIELIQQCKQSMTLISCWKSQAEQRNEKKKENKHNTSFYNLHLFELVILQGRGSIRWPLYHCIPVHGELCSRTWWHTILSICSVPFTTSSIGESYTSFHLHWPIPCVLKSHPHSPHSQTRQECIPPSFLSPHSTPLHRLQNLHNNPLLTYEVLPPRSLPTAPNRIYQEVGQPTMLH